MSDPPDLDIAAHVNWVRLTWAGGEHRFTLAQPPRSEFQVAESVAEMLGNLRSEARAPRPQPGAGYLPASEDPNIEPIGPLITRVMNGGWTAADLEAVIHVGLVRGEGDGVRKTLRTLLNKGVRGRPLAENLALAQTIIGASYVGLPEGQARG